ncbi:MAG: DUF6468 domain-containing protein [Stellaceae bacterium]
MLSLGADLVVAVLLIATIGYAAVLNRRLTAVRNDRDKFEKVIRELAVSSQRAESAVAGLRLAAEELGKRLDKKVDEGRALSDDLAYLIERGGSVADKLAAQIRAGRDAMKPDLKPEPRLAAPKPELLDDHRVEPVIRRPVAPKPQPQSQPQPQAALPAQPVRPISFEAILRRAPKPLEAAPPAPDPVPAIASRAERELLRALARRR